MYICIIIYKREILYIYIYEYQGVAVDGDGYVAGRSTAHACVRPHPSVAARERGGMRERGVSVCARECLCVLVSVRERKGERETVMSRGAARRNPASAHILPWLCRVRDMRGYMFQGLGCGILGVGFGVQGSEIGEKKKRRRVLASAHISVFGEGCLKAVSIGDLSWYRIELVWVRIQGVGFRVQDVNLETHTRHPRANIAHIRQSRPDSGHGF